MEKVFHQSTKVHRTEQLVTYLVASHFADMTFRHFLLNIDNFFLINWRTCLKFTLFIMANFQIKVSSSSRACSVTL